jgi:hypothetical protein
MGGRREPSQVRAAEPAAARRINPRRVKWFFIDESPIGMNPGAESAKQIHQDDAGRSLMGIE